MTTRRPFQWFTRIIEGQVVAAGAQACTDLLVGLPDANTKGATVTRVIMRLVTRPDTINELSHTLFGIAIVNADAAAAGAFPDADVEGDNVRWLVRGLHVNDSTSINSPEEHRISDYDLKAQARFRSEQEELHLILDQGSFGIRFDLLCRILVKLP